MYISVGLDHNPMRKRPLGQRWPAHSRAQANGSPMVFAHWKVQTTAKYIQQLIFFYPSWNTVEKQNGVTFWSFSHVQLCMQLFCASILDLTVWTTQTHREAYISCQKCTTGQYALWIYCVKKMIFLFSSFSYLFHSRHHFWESLQTAPCVPLPAPLCACCTRFVNKMK